MKTSHMIMSVGVLLITFMGCGGSDSAGTLNTTDITKQTPLTQVSIDTNVSAFTFVPYDTAIAASPSGMRPLLAPNSDGTWDVITSTYKKYWEEQKVWSFDLGTKSYVSSERLEFNASAEGWAGYTGALDKNGKLYILTRSQPNWHIHTYDADSNTFEFRKYTMPAYMIGGVSVIITGQNDKIYAAGGYSENGKNSTMIVEIDPNTGLMKEYKDIGVSNTTTTNAESIYVDKTHAYIITGRIPYRLTALNLSTLEETELGSKDSIIEIGSGSYGAFTNVDAPTGAVGAGAWLYNGGLHTYRQTSSSGVQTPPWSDGTDGKDYIYLTTPEDLYFPNKPEIYSTLIGEGVQKQLWFKAQGLEWDSMNVVMPQYTNAMKRLVKLQNTDALLISGDAYSGVALHDTNTHVQIYGSDPTASIAALESVGDKVYIAGYPNAMLHVLDTTKPFLGRVDFNNFHPDTVGVERTDDEMNPRLLPNLYVQGGCKTLYASTLAADGKVYFTGKWRDNGSGGCLSWIDTNDESTDGISEIFSNYRGRDITTTGDGRYLVISTTGVKDVNDPSKPEPEVGRLFIYDTQGDKTQVMKTIDPLENAVTAGYIVGSGGNTITGIANDASDAERVISYIYKVDIVTGEMIFKKQMDKGVSFVAYDDHKTHEIIKYYRGNVYFIAGWTWRDKVFVKVEADGSLTSVASLPLDNDFGDFECVGNDLYGLSGEVLKKVENVFN